MAKIILSAIISYCILAFISLEFNVLEWDPIGRFAFILVGFAIYLFNESLSEPEPTPKRITPTLEDGA